MEEARDYQQPHVHLDSIDSSHVESQHGHSEKQKQIGKEETHDPVPIWRLFAYCDSFDYILICLGTLGAAVHGAALPVYFYFFGKVLNSLGTYHNHPAQEAHLVGQYCILFVYLGLVTLCASWAEVACWMHVGERQTARIRIKYLEATLSQEIGFFDTDIRTGMIIDTMASDTVLVQEAISEKMGTFLHFAAAFIAGIAIGFTAVWKIGFVTVAIIPAIAFAGGVYNQAIMQIAAKSQQAYGEAGTIVEQAITQIRIVYAFVGEEKALQSYMRALKVTLKLGYKGGLAKGLGVGCTYMILFAQWAIVLWYATTLIERGQTDPTNVIISIFSVIWSGISLGQSLATLASVSKGRAAGSRIFEMIDRVAKVERQDEVDEILSDVRGNLELRNVVFSYPTRPQIVILKNLSLQIRSGQTVAIVGGSGSGKSTIITLIERFYQPISGQVLLDGADIQTLKLTWLRDQMGLVNQEPSLFATTILENIMHGKAGAEMAEVQAAAKAANAHAFITQLPDGYMTQVGERGILLSGGQKQRLAIARAMLRNPKVLLLDEATSALDATSERIVQEALEHLMVGRTTIVVAHRLSTVRNVDMIAVMKTGEIVEQGSHDELIGKGSLGAYSSLVKLQEMAQGEEGSPIRSRQASPASRHSSPAMQKLKRLSSSSSRDFRRLSSSSPRDSFRRFSSPRDSTAQKISRDANSDQSEMEDAPVAATTAMSMEKKTITSDGGNNGTYYWRLLKLNAPEWPYAMLGIVGSFLVGAINPINATLIGSMLKAFFYTNSNQLHTAVFRNCTAFAALALAAPFVYVLQNYNFAIVGENLANRVCQLMFKCILQNEMGWFDREENSGTELASCLAIHPPKLRAAMADRMMLVIQTVSGVVVGSIICFLICWRLTLVGLVTLPLLVGSFVAEKLFSTGFSGDIATAHTRATLIAGESVGNVRTVMAFNSQKKVVELVRSALREPERSNLLRGNIAGFCLGVAEFAKFGVHGLILGYGLILVKSGTCDFEGVIRVFMVFLVTAIAMAETLSLAPDAVKAGHATSSVFEILDRKTIINPEDEESQQVTKVKGMIEMRKVTFAYPTRPEAVIFENFNLRVDAGKSLALVGGSGSGKSSVISLILRFYDPISGQVLIDGQDVRQMNLRSLRLRIGLVQQEPCLFATSIYENIRYGRVDATEAEVISAATAANAHRFVSALPDGYRTQVGERGVQLSGGQKQRLAIARAMLKDPSILLLDEATSALDAESERVVQEALDQLMRRRTTVLVAHRLSTIRNASSIAVVQNGRILEQGSHHDLIAKPNGAYARLVHIQRHNAHVITDLP